jgi:hypothetical protein
VQPRPRDLEVGTGSVYVGRDRPDATIETAIAIPTNVAATAAVCGSTNAPDLKAVGLNYSKFACNGAQQWWLAGASDSKHVWVPPHA